MEKCCDSLLDLLSPKFFKALGDPNRITMFCRLADCRGSMTVSEMAEEFPINISVVSRHLATLREAGLLNSERVGKEVRYSIRMKEVVALLRNIANGLESCCVKPFTKTEESNVSSGQ